MSNKPEYSIFDPAEIPCEEISDANALVKEPLVSVCMITYNHKPYIAQAIQGVLRQETSFLFELVIGEDCSTDGTHEIVLEFQKKYPNMIRVMTSDHNVGARKNSRRTEKACRGKYIAYCDGDDYWHHPQKLQKQVDFLESHPEVGLVHSECNFHYVESNKIVVNYYEKKGRCWEAENAAERLIDLRCAMPVTCTVCLRKNVTENFIANYPELFSEKWPFGDLQRWFGVALNSSVFFFRDSLATRRVLPESASHSKNINKQIDFSEKSYEFRVFCIEKFNLSNDAKYSVLFSKSGSLLWLSFLAFKPKLARDSKHILSKLGKKFSLRQNLIYLGTQYKSANIILKFLRSLLRILFPKQEHGY